MDATLKTEWMKALRGGEFEQGHTRFQDGKRYCCLGVLCVVAGEPPFKGEHSDSEDNWTFVRRAVPELTPDDEVVWVLARMNDRGVPFPEIADYIEKVL